MFGLVTTEMERIGLRSKSVAPVPDVLPKPATFKEELAAKGISAIPLKEVRAYQARYLTDQKGLGLAGDFADWIPESPSDYRRLGGKIPPGVEQTIRRAETIPDSRVVVERFYADPFVFVVRKKDGRREEACIAYWNAPGFKPE